MRVGVAMTEQTAQRIANVALGAAALGAAYYVVRTPPLRRLALGLAMTGPHGRAPGVADAGAAAARGLESGRRAI